MSSTDVSGQPRAATVDMKLEVVTLPVSDVDRAKDFYLSLGWRLDADFMFGADVRAVQVTPLHSGCSVAFGKGSRQRRLALPSAWSWSSMTSMRRATISSVAASR